MTSFNFQIYRASAGSGKTYTLALQYIKQLLVNNRENPHRNLMAVTFTNDATGEIKNRILKELYGLGYLPENNDFMQSIREELPKMTESAIAERAQKALHAILHDYSHFHITTIDSFFQQVLRNLARELGKGSHFNIELNSELAIQDAVTSLLEKSNNDPQILERITRFLSFQLEDGKWNIERKLSSFGKQVFNETFYQSEDELRKQLSSNPDIINQLISKCRKVKKQFEEQMEHFASSFFGAMEAHQLENNAFSRGFISSYYNKISNKKQYDDENLLTKGITDALEDVEKWFAKTNPKRNLLTTFVEGEFLPLLQKTEEFRLENLIDYNSAVLFLKYVHQLELLADISKELEIQNHEENRFMLAHTSLLLHEMIDPELDASFIFEKIGAEIKNVMIDEFQDTSQLQWHNFKGLLSEIVATNRFSMLVGDVKQSIYRWRNSDWHILNDIEKEYPINLHTLDTNYRSSWQVVNFNNVLFQNMSKILADKYDEQKNGAIGENPFRKAYHDVTQKVPSKTAVENSGYVSVVVCEKDQTLTDSEVMMEQLVKQLQLLYEANVTPADICILCRTNKQLRVIADYFHTVKGDYPEMESAGYFHLFSSDTFQLSNSPALQLVMAALRFIADTDNQLAMAEIAFLWHQIQQDTEKMADLSVFFTNQDIKSALPKSFQEQYSTILPGLPLFDLVQTIFGLFSLYKMENQTAYMFAFMDYLTDFLHKNSSNIQSFIAYWEVTLQHKTIAVSKDGEVKGIRAMSIHKSKGLEFHTVIVPFCDWKMAEKSGFHENMVWCRAKPPLLDLPIMPISYSAQMEHSLFEEEYQRETELLWMDNLNVLYVAFTRAENNLIALMKQPPKTSASISLSELIITVLSSMDSTSCQWMSGAIVSSAQQAENARNRGKNNPFSQQADDNILISYPCQPITTKRMTFMPSQKALRFIQGKEEGDFHNEYIQEGNIIHQLFSLIYTMDDIPKAVAQLVAEGSIAAAQSTHYITTITEQIRENHVEHWFSDQYEVWNETSILSQSDKQLHRPDRVMRSKTTDEIIIVDYKTGVQTAKHQHQLDAYIQLLQEMGYKNVKGVIWYNKWGVLYKLYG